MPYGAGQGNCGRGPGYVPGGGRGAVQSVAALADLSALDMTGYDSGALAFVESLRGLWMYRASADPLVPFERVASATPGYVWERRTATEAGNPWASQAEWYIEPAGNDEAVGGAGSPLQTVREWTRRIGRAPITAVVRMHLGAGLDRAEFGDVRMGESGYLWIDGAQTNDGNTYHLTTYTAENPAAGVNEYVVLSALDCDFSTAVGKRLRFTTGAAAGGTATVAKADPAGGGIHTARINQIIVCAFAAGVPGTLPVVPAAGDEFVVETLPEISNWRLHFESESRAQISYDDPVQVMGLKLRNQDPAGGWLQELAPNSQQIAYLACDIDAPTVLGAAIFLACYLHNGAAGSIELRCMGGTQQITGWYCLTGPVLLNQSALFWSVVQGGVSLGANTGTVALYDSAVFDSPGHGIEVMNPSGTYAVGGSIWGKGHAGAGLKIYSGNIGTYNVTVPTITGAAGDLNAAGAAMLWAALPFFDAVHACGLVNNAT